MFSKYYGCHIAFALLKKQMFDNVLISRLENKKTRLSALYCNTN